MDDLIRKYDLLNFTWEETGKESIFMEKNEEYQISHKSTSPNGFTVIFFSSFEEINNFNVIYLLPENWEKVGQYYLSVSSLFSDHLCSLYFKGLEAGLC